MASAELLVSSNTESLNTKLVSVVGLSSEPVLTTVVGESFEVVSESLVNFDLISVLA